MNSYIVIFGILLLGFFVYFFMKDRIFKNEIPETYQSNPAPIHLENTKPQLYPQNVITSSGPNPPNSSASSQEIVMYSSPSPTDPYQETHVSSEIPEELRHPERAYRPAHNNTNTNLANQSGNASSTIQVSSDASQQMESDIIQGGGEFMPGIFANDTLVPTHFSTF